MCLSLTLTIFGSTLFFQGCINPDPASLPGKVEAPIPAITTEEWAPVIAKADPEEDGSITYLFRDAAGRVHPAVALCVESVPREENGKVRIVQIKAKNLTVYNVACADAPKIM